MRHYCNCDFANLSISSRLFLSTSFRSPEVQLLLLKSIAKSVNWPKMACMRCLFALAETIKNIAATMFIISVDRAMTCDGVSITDAVEKMYLMAWQKHGCS